MCVCENSWFQLPSVYLLAGDDGNSGPAHLEGALANLGGGEERLRESAGEEGGGEKAAEGGVTFPIPRLRTDQDRTRNRNPSSRVSERELNPLEPSTKEERKGTEGGELMGGKREREREIRPADNLWTAWESSRQGTGRRHASCTWETGRRAGGGRSSEWPPGTHPRHTSPAWWGSSEPCRCRTAGGAWPSPPPRLLLLAAVGRARAPLRPANALQPPPASLASSSPAIVGVNPLLWFPGWLVDRPLRLPRFSAQV